MGTEKFLTQAWKNCGEQTVKRYPNAHLIETWYDIYQRQLRDNHEEDKN